MNYADVREERWGERKRKGRKGRDRGEREKEERLCVCV